MDSKEMKLSQSYLYGFFASMIGTLIYSAIIIPLYILIISLNPQNFLVYLLYTLDIWVWIWISVSMLYAFIIVYLFSNKRTSFRNNVSSFLFFLVTSMIVLLSLSYIPEIQKILYKEEYTFYTTLLSICLFFVSVQLSYSMKKVIVFMYKLILFNLGYNIKFETSVEDELEDFEYEDVSHNISEYESFSNLLSSIIAFSQRHNYAVGLMAFKISNYKLIIEEYGNRLYDELRDDIVKFIKKNSRIGEGQCLVDDETIYTIIYADEEEALKTTRRYFKLFKKYDYKYNNKESINLDIAIAVSGFDFSHTKLSKISSFVIKDNLTNKIKDVLMESEKTENPIIFYYKGI